MVTHPMNISQIIITCWFVASVAIAVGGNVIFYVWLKSQKISLRFSLAGTPGYLDRAYVEWCRGRGTSPAGVLWCRGLTLVSLIASSISLVVWVALQ